MIIDSAEVAEGIIRRLLETGEFPSELEEGDVQLGGWAQLQVFLPRPPADASVSYPYLEAFVDIQRQIYQLAALIETGIADVAPLI